MKEQTQTNEQTIKQRLTHEIRRELSREEPETSAPADTDRFTYTVTDQDVNMTVKLILKKRLGFSKRLLIRLKQGEGKVTRNGRKVRLFADVIAGDVIQAELPAERCHFIPQDILPFSVLFLTRISTKPVTMVLDALLAFLIHKAVYRTVVCKVLRRPAPKQN